MSDIVLVEGLNELNVAMTPLVVGVAEFVYASDIRQQGYQRPGYPEWATGISFEVDIKNIGGSPGTCTPIAHIETCYGDNSVGMGTQTIDPGQTVTFSGNWYWPYGVREEGEWWRAGYIRSEAGDITFLFGRSIYFVSFDIPAPLVAGSQYWASQVIHLPGGNYTFEGTLSVGGAVASRGTIGVNTVWDDIILTTAKDYTLRGISTRLDIDPDGNLRPKGTMLQAVAPARGIYPVTHSLHYRSLVYLGDNQWGASGPSGYLWQNKVVGQVQIV